MNKAWLLSLVFYVIVHGPQGDYSIQYDGMSQATIGRLLAEKKVRWEFVSEKKYNAFVNKANAAKPKKSR